MQGALEEASGNISSEGLSCIRPSAGTFPLQNGLKQRGDLSPFLFIFTLEYAIRRVQVNQEGLKLNGTHQLLVYANDDNLLTKKIYIYMYCREKNRSVISR